MKGQCECVRKWLGWNVHAAKTYRTTHRRVFLKVYFTQIWKITIYSLSRRYKLSNYFLLWKTDFRAITSTLWKQHKNIIKVAHMSHSSEAIWLLSESFKWKNTENISFSHSNSEKSMLQCPIVERIIILTQIFSTNRSNDSFTNHTALKDLVQFWSVSYCITSEDFECVIYEQLSWCFSIYFEAWTF